MDKIRFIGESEAIELYVLDSTRLAGINYLLASDVEAGDGECYILKETTPEDSAEAVYEMVEDNGILDYLAGIFAEQLEDVDIEF